MLDASAASTSLERLWVESNDHGCGRHGRNVDFDLCRCEGVIADSEDMTAEGDAVEGEVSTTVGDVRGTPVKRHAGVGYKRRGDVANDADQRAVALPTGARWKGTMRKYLSEAVAKWSDEPGRWGAAGAG